MAGFESFSNEWKRGDEEIVKIDENGTIIPQSSGETKIHIESYYDGYIKDVPITIEYIPHYTIHFDSNDFDDLFKYKYISDNFKNEFKKQALNIKGSGYTFLVIDNNKKLRVINTSNQDNPYYYGYVPVMALDVWEHAYYLDYYSNREEYIDKFLEIVDFVKLNINYENILKS